MTTPRSIAGSWDADESGGGARYVLISDDGRYTDHVLDDSGEGDNCYFVTPMQLDVELAATDEAPGTYSIADGRSFTAATDERMLVVNFVADDSQEGVEMDTDTQSWSAVEGLVLDDLPVCADETAPAGENLLPGEEPEPGDVSMPAPGTDPNAPPVVDGEPSETDTSAVAGLWIADSDAPEARIDRRYVQISGSGLYTEYDDQQDALGSGDNCYVVTPRRLDFETGEPLDGTYSASGLPSFTIEGTDGGDTLTVTPFESDGGSGEPVVWERADDGIAVESLSACEG